MPLKSSTADGIPSYNDYGLLRKREENEYRNLAVTMYDRQE